MRKKKFVAGNWKMYMNRLTAVDLAGAVRLGVGEEDRVTVAICPPFPYLLPVSKAIHGSKVALGGQDCYVEKDGAFTGEVSPTMLADVHCKYVILGHSERRHKLGESDEFINAKVKAALAAGLQVILCIGETLEEREANQTEAVLDRHITKGLAGIPETELARITLAYEPVWAIGTGKNATPQQAQDAHVFIRKGIRQIYSENAAADILIQYGGSVKPDNAASLLHQPDVDGALVGGASLKADQFLAIFRAALPPG
jgi:triosephosphate isomerase (TIM)